MSKIFLYSRVSTSQQTLEQQERTAYEWLDSHHMKVDEVVSDEGVSGGVSYADRKLGKELLPKTENGDMIIVSEISRLGRSMYDLSKLIHKELKPRKLRLVVV
jgi:DNA invertase Pin-like site-specific DNA recombinase